MNLLEDLSTWYSIQLHEQPWERAQAREWMKKESEKWVINYFAMAEFERQRYREDLHFVAVTISCLPQNNIDLEDLDNVFFRENMALACETFEH